MTDFRIERMMEANRVRSADELALRAVGSYLGAPLPHPYGCFCSQHWDPCPHDLRHYMRGYFDLCARCGIPWPGPK